MSAAPLRILHTDRSDGGGGREARRRHIPVLPMAMDGNFGLGAVTKPDGTPALARARLLDIPLKRAWRHFVPFLPDGLAACGDTMRRRRNNLRPLALR